LPLLKSSQVLALGILKILASFIYAQPVTHTSWQIWDLGHIDDAAIWLRFWPDLRPVLKNRGVNAHCDSHVPSCRFSGVRVSILSFSSRSINEQGVLNITHRQLALTRYGSPKSWMLSMYIYPMLATFATGESEPHI
jgi:hypothetical protein